jgi:(1->4)-alpha-D-glucan 1-alpha-D-glucosylmutase
MRRSHSPVSSYRLQFSSRFTFQDAVQLVPYLVTLGVTDCYTSPLLHAVPGSEHGYDITDHGVLNPELGTEAEFQALSSALRAHDMGLLLDFVPNHMSLDACANSWWRDVLQHGPDSRYAGYFDIDWTGTPEHPRGCILLPILEDPYGNVLHRGEIRLVVEEGVPAITYRDRRLPLASGTFTGDTAADAAAFIGTPDEPASWDQLHALLERQWYRLAHWKTSFDEINYRRFFDINQLGGLRIEEPEVFAAAHRKVFELIAQGHVTGLRLDHLDGLLDPAGYLDRLQETISALPSSRETADRFHVIVEKILAHGELVPAGWPIAGTTGYGFLNQVNGLFVDPTQEAPMRRLYAAATHRRDPFATVSYESRRLMTRSSMASELSVLTRALKRIAEMDRTTRDHTARALARAIAETVSRMTIYRTYVAASGFSAVDRDAIDYAVDDARRSNPVMAPAIFLFLRQVLLAEDEGSPLLAEKRRFAMKFQQFSAPIQAKGIEDTAFYRYNALISLNEIGGDPGRFGASVDDFHAANGSRLAHWRREMTTTATHDTKRGEDARARLNVLSELPQEWQRSVMRWRRINAVRHTAVDRESAPDANDEYLFYQALIGAWPLEPVDAALPAEAPAELVERLTTFMLKAIREAKTHTSWVHQNRAYEDALGLFIETTLRQPSAGRFLAAFVPFARRVGQVGVFNSLAQVVLKIASPGVPDFYQGTELWQLDFTDPDNRRPIDFNVRQQLLTEMRPWLQLAEKHEGSEALATYVADLLHCAHDGRIKMFVTAAGLRLRRAWADVFVDGAYLPLTVNGTAATHVVAFARQHGGRLVVAAVPRLTASLGAAPHHRWEAWQQTAIATPAALEGLTLWDAFTSTSVTVNEQALDVRSLFRIMPVALLTVQLDGPRTPSAH